MPGLIVYKRRWNIGSDDLFLPAALLLCAHTSSCIFVSSILSLIRQKSHDKCYLVLSEYLIGNLIVVLVAIIIELMIAIVSLKGSIIVDTEPRRLLRHLIYTRSVLSLFEICSIISGCIILVKFSNQYAIEMRRALVCLVLVNSFLMSIILLGLMCSYDKAGKSFYKLKRLERTCEKYPDMIRLAEPVHHRRYKRTFHLYHKSWIHRLRIYFCCFKERKYQRAFNVIADTFSNLFYKYDLVPSDVVAGLLLLKEQQKLVENESHIFNENAKIFDLSVKENMVEFKRLLYFYHYAISSYGWPMYAYKSKICAFVKLLSNIKYCSCTNSILSCSKTTRYLHDIEIEDDNCCFCNYDGVIRLLPANPFKKSNDKSHIQLVYCSFYSDFECPAFFIAVDYTLKKVVLVVRGTGSLTDAMTDMQHTRVRIPVDEYEWYGHQGMTNSALYIKSKIQSNELLERAFNLNKAKNTDKFSLLIVGHSMGAGTGAILSILLRDEYPNVKCFAYSTPGGLLSENCMEMTKSFITNVILGNDMIPRIGMHQMERLQFDIINALKSTRKSKV